jgi:hypothetical protein
VRERSTSKQTHDTEGAEAAGVYGKHSHDTGLTSLQKGLAS